MEEAVKQAITDLAAKARKTTSSDEAMKYAQAALNLANTAVTLVNVKMLEAQLK